MTITREQAVEMAREAGFPKYVAAPTAELELLCNLAAAHQAKQDEQLFVKALDRHAMMLCKTSNGYVVMNRGVFTAQEGV